jgi:hypothetical protein
LPTPQGLAGLRERPFVPRRAVKKRRHDTVRNEAEACRAGVGGPSPLPLRDVGQGRPGLTLELREPRRDLGEVLEPRLALTALAEVA